MRRAQPTLYRFAGRPVLTVGQIPEVDGVGRIEVGLGRNVLRKRPCALDMCPVGCERCHHVRHHVVGMQADEQVGVADEVHDGAQLVLREALDRHATAGPGERHGLRALDDRHPATHPGAAEFEVLTAGRRADPRQFGVDGRAVVALLVVLGDHLPIGGQFVGVPGDDGQVLGAVRADDVLQARDVLAEVHVRSAGIDEQPAVPVDQS